MVGDKALSASEPLPQDNRFPGIRHHVDMMSFALRQLLEPITAGGPGHSKCGNIAKAA